MKIIVQCQHCKKYTDIESDNVGRTVDVNNFFELRIESSWNIGNTDDLEEMNEISESDVEVNNLNIRFNCQECGEYIVLEF